MTLETAIAVDIDEPEYLSSDMADNLFVVHNEVDGLVHFVEALKHWLGHTSDAMAMVMVLMFVAAMNVTMVMNVLHLGLGSTIKCRLSRVHVVAMIAT